MGDKDQVIRVVYDDADARRAIDKTNAALDSQDQSFTRLEASMIAANQALGLVSSAFNAAATAARALVSVVEQGQAFTELSTAFQNLYGQTQTFANDGLGKLREALGGTVNDIELLKSANQAAQAGLSPDAFLTLAEAAESLGDTIGAGPAEALQGLSHALATGQERALKRFGVIVDSAKAEEAFAKAIGTTRDQLSEAGKLEAFRAAALEQIAEKAKNAGDASTTAGDQFEKLGVSASNAFTAFAEGVNTSEGLVGVLTSIVDQTSLPREEIVKLGNATGELAAAFGELLLPAMERVTEALTLVSNLAGGAGTAMDGLATVVREVSGAVGETLGNLVLPSGLLDSIKSVNQGLVEQKKAAEEAAKAAESSFDEAGNPVSEEQFNRLVEQRNRALRDRERLLKHDADAARKAAEEVAKLRREFELTDKVEFQGISAELADAIENVDQSAFDSVIVRMEAEFKRLRTAELSEKYGKAVDDAQIAERVRKEWELAANGYRQKMGEATEDVAEKQAQDLKRAQEEVARKFEQAQKEAFSNSVDFFTEIINGAIEGDIADVLERMLIQAAVKFGAEMLAQITGSFSLEALGGLGGLGGLGAFLGGGTGIPGLQGGPPLVNGQIAATSGFPALLAAIPAFLTAQNSISGVQNFANGNDLSFAEQTALALPTFGASYFSNEINDFFGGGISGQQAHLGDIVNAMTEAGILGPKGTFQLFGGGEGRLQASQGGDLQAGSEQFTGLSNLLSIVTTGEVDEQFSGLFANALAQADSFNAAALTTVSILEDSGVSAEQAGELILQAYEDGKISIEEMNSAINTTTQLAQNDLPSLADGIQLFAESLDDPRSAVKALGLLFNEFTQAGITDTQQMADIIRTELGDGVADAFENIIAAGIDTSEEFANATVPQLQLIYNEIYNANEAWQQYGDAGEEASDRTVEGLQRVGQEADRARERIDALSRAIRTMPPVSSDNFGAQQ